MKLTICKSIILIIILTQISLIGQEVLCDMPSAQNPIASDPEYVIRTPKNIPVIIHVVYKSDNSGNVTDEQIQSQIQILNQEFSNNNTKYSFTLVGITRTESDYWQDFLRAYSKETEMTNALTIDPKHVLNIFIINTGTSPLGTSDVLGWTINFPWAVSETSLKNGIVVHYNTLPGGDFNNYNEGMTVVHETGHFLGLYHTFENGCLSPGDRVADTPPHQANFQCPEGAISVCNEVDDPIHNYMNYTYDDCKYQFTEGQKTRMDEIVGQHRPNLGGTIIDFSSDLTIATGRTYNFYNCTLKFAAGKKIIVNGTLNVNGTSGSIVTFDRNGTSGTWGGIQFNSGSSGTINYANIQRADYGIRFNNAGTTSIMVSNSTIQNNTAGGIYFYNTYAKIHDNIIQNNGSLGIWCDNYSSPELVGNTITGHSNYGLKCHYYSSAKLAELNVYYSGGYNSITSNSGYGIYADYYSNLYLGSAPYGGYNNIYSNSNYELAALYSCNIAAENNYWGSNPSSEIYQYQSTVDFTPYLQSQAQSQLNIMEPSIAEASTTISGSTQTNPELEKAFELYITGKYEEAIQVYNQIFEKGINEKDRIYALIGLNDCYKTSGKEGFLNFINSVKSYKSINNNELLTVALELENRILLEEKNFNQVIQNLETIINNPLSVPESKKYALYSSCYIYLNFLNDRNKAEEIFSRLEKEFPDDQLVSDSKFLLTGEQIQNKETILTKNNSTEQNETTVPQSFKLIGNYPNPFNPTTIINYSVPATSNVKISIYDIAGSLIKSFYSNSLNAGIHSVEWDGTNESGIKISSGTYIYRMEAVSLENNGEMFADSKKMILLK